MYAALSLAYKACKTLEVLLLEFGFWAFWEVKYWSLSTAVEII